MVAVGATAESGLGNPNLLAAMWSFAIVIAVNQIGVATTIVRTLFMAAAGTVAVALALGLGGRETATAIVRSWYEQDQQAAPKLGAAAEAASSQAHHGSVTSPALETKLTS